MTGERIGAMEDDPMADAGAEPAAGAVPPAASAVPPADASLLALVDRLATLLERSDLLELEVEAGGTGIVLRKAAALVGGGQLVTALDPLPGRAPDPIPVREARPANPGPPARSAVLAPLTGIFYASPTPGRRPSWRPAARWSSARSSAHRGMKLFNEIKSDKAGRVVRVVPENGTLVKAKHPLIEVEPL